MLVEEEGGRALAEEGGEELGVGGGRGGGTGSWGVEGEDGEGLEGVEPISGGVRDADGREERRYRWRSTRGRAFVWVRYGTHGDGLHDEFDGLT